MLWTLLLAVLLLLLLQAQLHVCLRFSANTTQRLPGAIIIGVRKGGTRALLEMLSLHPNVRTARAEVHFFNRDENYRQGLSWYLSHMPVSTPGQLTVEKTPGYFVSSVAPSRVHSLDGSMRLLLIVRDPAERLVSDYTQVLLNRMQRHKPYPPLEELLLQKDGHVDTLYRALQRSLYHEPLSRWLAHFPHTQLHVVDGDALVQDPFPQMQQVEKFLGLPPHITASHFRFNATKGFYCLLVSGQERCLDASKGRKHAPLGLTAYRTLCRFLEEPNKVFFSMVGRSFNWC